MSQAYSVYRIRFADTAEYYARPKTWQAGYISTRQTATTKGLPSAWTQA